MRLRKFFDASLICMSYIYNFAGSIFSMPLDCSRLAWSSSVRFRSGGTKPEVVFPVGARCHTRVFLTVPSCLRLAQSISAVAAQTGSSFPDGFRCRRRVFQIAVDHPRLAQSLGTSSTALKNYFRFGAATLDIRTNRPAEPPPVPIRRKKPSRTPASAP